jgi:PKHD-type hydroxylase
MKFTKFDTDCVVCKDALTSEQVDTIRTIGDSYYSLGIPDMSTGDTSKRKTWTVFLSRTRDTKPIYDLVSPLVRNINEQFYRFNLTGYDEQGLLYSTYDKVGDHYGWHTDKTDKYRTRALVKLSVVVQLSDPSEYEGGEAQIHTDGIIPVEKGKGLVYAFPGWVSHRVTPITSGVRRSLILWMTGPKFK